MARKKSGKLTRTEVVPVRFDPKLKMAAELLAARERRTLSSLTEWVMERAVKEMPVTTNADGQLVTAWQVANECWDEKESLRILNLGNRYIELLTYEERRIFSLIFDMVEMEKIYLEKTIPDIKDKYDDEFIGRIILQLVTNNELWGLIIDCSNNKISEKELFTKYLNNRYLMFPWFIEENKDILEIKKLMNSDLIEQYPEAKIALKNFFG